MGLAVITHPLHQAQAICTSYCGPEVEIGPEFRAKTRKFAENLTFAHVPTPFAYMPTLKYVAIEVDKLMKKPKVSASLLVAIKDCIQDQFENRIASFWTQALLVYKTGLQFYFCDHADAQIGGPGGKGLVPAEERVASRKYAAAHVATLPALRVVSSNTTKAIAFGQGSFFHHQANATVWLPAVVNLVDSKLDRHARIKGSTRSFRALSTQILNDLARGDFNPQDGLNFFLSNAVGHIQILQLTETSKKKQIILQNYLEVAKIYIKKIKASDYIIRALSCQLSTKLHGEEFYMYVQSAMHGLFKEQMQTLQPAVIYDPLLAARMNTELHPKRFTKFIKFFFDEEVKNAHSKLKSTPTVDKYVKFSLTNQNVHTAALIYLTKISQDELQRDLQCTLEIKRKKTIKKAGLSLSLYAVYDEILKSLAIKISEPQNMSTIVIKILHNISALP